MLLRNRSTHDHSVDPTGMIVPRYKLTGVKRELEVLDVIAGRQGAFPEWLEVGCFRSGGHSGPGLILRISNRTEYRAYDQRSAILVAQWTAMRKSIAWVATVICYPGTSNPQRRPMSVTS